MSALKIETVTEVKSLLAEGPVWDAKRKVICWIDILNGKIHEWSEKDAVYRETDVKQMIGSMAICSDGNYIAALQNGFAFINRESREVKMITDPEAHLSNNRFNDGKCDPAGRFWAGTMSLTEDHGAGSLYTLDNDLSYSKMREKVTISNGLAWSLDHKTVYHIDTPTLTVTAFDYENESGRISNQRTAILIEEKDGFPDGMTIDSEGMLWIAHWNGWQVTRWNPVSGKKLYAVSMPVAKVTSCTFGGDDFNDLYITTAKVDLTPEELQRQPLAGSLFVIRNCGFTGLPAFEFKVHS